MCILPTPQAIAKIRDYLQSKVLFFLLPLLFLSFVEKAYRVSVNNSRYIRDFVKTGERPCCIYRFSSSISLRTSDHIPTNDLSGERRGGKTARERYDPLEK